jgi:Protein of unknown function/Domain of unknown function (DUF1835)
LAAAEHLHICFSASTARTLARLVRRKKIAPAVAVSNPDLLFIGPLADVAAPLARLTWINAFDPYRFDPWYCEPDEAAAFTDGIAKFWNTLNAWQGPAIVWYSSASAQEATGFLTVAKLAVRAPEFEFVDVHILPGKAQHTHTGALSDDEIIAALPYATRLSDLELAIARDSFDRLAADPDPVRFIRGGKLLTGLASVHDAEIEYELEADFQTGEAVTRLIFAAQAQQTEQADKKFYAFRLKFLAETGAIDARADAYELTASEVRDLTPSADMLDENRLHIVGTYAALGLVKRHSITAGKPIRHIIETRNLFPALGPLSTLNQPQARIDWFRNADVDVHRHMSIAPEQVAEMLRDWQDLWTRLDRWSGPVTFWMSSRSAADRSLQLAVAHHCRRAVMFEFVDVADPDISDPPLPNVEMASADQITAAARRASPMSEAALALARTEYARLAAAPKGLRFFKAGNLAEGLLDQFDDRILNIVTPHSRSLSRTMEDIIAEEHDEGHDQVDHFFWLWRFEELVLAGRIQVEGSDFGDWRIRLATAKPNDEDTEQPAIREPS